MLVVLILIVLSFGFFFASGEGIEEILKLSIIILALIRSQL